MRRVINLARRSGGWIVYLAALLAGCGGGADGIAVEGQVTLDGQPLETGSITFLPLESGRSVGATIEHGKFELPAARGPQAGRYRVEIVSYAPTGRQIADPDLPGEMTEELASRIPPRYNTQTELTTEFSAGDSAQVRYDLTSDTQ